MVIGANSLGSFLFQSMDPSDLGLYTYNANGQFVPVSIIIIGNVVINTTAVVIGNNMTVNSTTMQIGNSSANLVANVNGIYVNGVLKT